MDDTSSYTIPDARTTFIEPQVWPECENRIARRQWLEGRFQCDNERIMFVAATGLIYRVQARRAFTAPCDVPLMVLVEFLDHYLVDILTTSQIRPSRMRRTMIRAADLGSRLWRTFCLRVHFPCDTARIDGSS
jgi:hypothetical protein